MQQLKPSPRELIIQVSPEADLRVTEAGVSSRTHASLYPLESMLSAVGARLRPAFGMSEEWFKRNMTKVIDLAVDAASFYRVIAPEVRLEAIAAKLLELEIVEAAFVKPGSELALIYEPDQTRPMTTLTMEQCDFNPLQVYRGPAPDGVDSDFAQTVTGGRGHQVNIIDIELAWCFSHVDLLQNLGGLIGGLASTQQMDRHHGTAVLGVMGGDVNDFGVTGICPEANIRTVSILGNQPSGCTSDWGPAAAIKLAADRLCCGDIIVIEHQTPGPIGEFRIQANQSGYIPIEWWPDNLLAIKYATNLGIIVVEAGGNGASDLTDPIYDVAQPGFPAFWRNPFRRSPIDSGAIIVGAGAPPLGFNGTNFGEGRSRLPDSNYGCMFDAQGWGRVVTTCGFGDQNCGADEEFKYTEYFGGTSSATPIVAGALACIQGILKAAGEDPLTPAAARRLLRTTGSPQTDGPNGPASQRIGSLPDLRAMIKELAPKRLRLRNQP